MSKAYRAEEASLRDESFGLSGLAVVKKVERAIEKYRPEIIYTHHFGDLNIDHQITAKAVES